VAGFRASQQRKKLAFGGLRNSTCKTFNRVGVAAKEAVQVSTIWKYWVNVSEKTVHSGGEICKSGAAKNWLESIKVATPPGQRCPPQQAACSRIVNPAFFESRFGSNHLGEWVYSS